MMLIWGDCPSHHDLNEYQQSFFNQHKSLLKSSKHVIDWKTLVPPTMKTPQNMHPGHSLKFVFWHILVFCRVRAYLKSAVPGDLALIFVQIWAVALPSPPTPSFSLLLVASRRF